MWVLDCPFRYIESELPDTRDNKARKDKREAEGKINYVLLLLLN